MNASSKPSTWKLLRNRTIAGMFVVLPVFVTWVILKWLYDTVDSILIGPIRDWLLQIWYPAAFDGNENHQQAKRILEAAGITDVSVTQTDGDPSNWVINLLASLAAFALVLGVLFIAGMFFRSRVHRLVDWLFSTVPGVNTIYKAVSNVVEAISRSSTTMDNFKRVVLVQFPHPGMKVPGFVTSECKDEHTGRDILCIYVPTTPVPSSGYMLLVPQEEVIEVNWDLQETLQAIVSGGITVPPLVTYFRKPEVRRTQLANSPDLTLGKQDGSDD